MLPDKITYADKYGPAMKITDQAEADRYFALCVEHQMRISGCDQTRAVYVEGNNLGYYAGYYDNETRKRVERLYRCAHPFLGAIAEKGPPTPEEAFEMGRALASTRH